MSSMLCFLVIDIKEEDLLKNLISQNYFYFSSTERSKILSLCFEIMADDFPESFDEKFNILYDCFYNYISSNKHIILDGFINFRIKPYINILENILSESINNFIIEKEYLEFISLLKFYVNSQPHGCEFIHLVYSSSESILLDENKNIIISTDEIFKAKYLSDISFSSNDYALNTLLNLLPKKIYIHLINNYIDEFINTIQLVFENKVQLCTDCDICKIYKISKSNSTKQTK